MGEPGGGEFIATPPPNAPDSWHNKEKAEFLAYAGDSFEQMAVLAAKNGMAETDVERIRHLADEPEAKLETEYDERQVELATALKLASAIRAGSEKEGAALRLYIPAPDQGYPIPDLDLYLQTRQKLYQALGVSDQRPSDEELMASKVKSPLGVEVIEYHSSQEAGENGEDGWHGDQGVWLNKPGHKIKKED